jgi:glycosyltransferase involved in cell wall biosynthesis
MDYERFNDKQIFNLLSRFGNPAKIKVLYVSAYIPSYVRTETIFGILHRNKIQVKLILAGNKRLRYFRAIFDSIFKLRDCDVIFLAFRSHEILPFFRLLTRKPIIFDAFVSAYDTLCFDRKVFKPDSIVGKILKWCDAYLCKIANLVLVDTKAHCEYFKNEFNVKNITYLYLECNKKLFKPVNVEKEKNKFAVFWYGKCWPLQGVDVILKAAEILKDEPEIIFRLVGPIRKKYPGLLGKLNTQNIEFIDYVPYEELPLEIARADLCLAGHFSDIPKAKRVIPGKAFQFIACGRKTILGDNPANRELFSEADNIYFAKMNSEEELAKIILKIKEQT